MRNATIIQDNDPLITRTVYIVTGKAIEGDGSTFNPFVAPYGDLDAIWPRIQSGDCVRLLAGYYTTRGLMLPKVCAIIGSGMGQTVITLKDDCTTNWSYPHCRMIYEANWCELAIVKDLTLNGNFSAQKTGIATGNFKVEPVHIRSIRAKVENVYITDFGAAAAAYGQQGLEAFPLWLATFSSGAPRMYDAQYAALRDTEATSFIEVVGCKVVSPTFMDGGYCTAIFVNTNQPNAGDRQAMGIRDCNAALVRGCYVSVPGGIAYGCAESEQVQFEGNIAEWCKCGFNHDTGRLIHARISGNLFLKCAQGVNVKPTGGSDVEVSHNGFLITEPFFNPVTQQTEPGYTVSKAAWVSEVGGYAFNS